MLQHYHVSYTSYSVNHPLRQPYYHHQSYNNVRLTNGLFHLNENHFNQALFACGIFSSALRHYSVVLLVFAFHLVFMHGNSNSLTPGHCPLLHPPILCSPPHTFSNNKIVEQHLPNEGFTDGFAADQKF